MKKVFVVSFVTIVLFGGAMGLRGASSAESKTSQAENKLLMQQKLEQAQILLEGLALGDFAKIAKCANELSKINAQSNVMRTDAKYIEYSAQFLQATDRVSKMAEKQNIEGATLNYVQVILTCVECHKAVRGAQEVAWNTLTPPIAPPAAALGLEAPPGD